MIDLSGRCGVVTGGSRGVGRATALLLARAGAAVGIGYRSRETEAMDVVEAIRAEGVEGWAEKGDLSVAEEAEAFLARADREFGRIDFFVGNAGIWIPEDVPLESMIDEQWRRTMRVNLDSIFYTTRAAVPRLAPGAAVVLVASTAAQRGEAFHGDYAASKGAIVSLVKGLAVELAPRDVTVNAVAPGWIETEMAEPALDGGRREEVARSIPRGRIASAEDVAGPIVFLCSALARHITGEILNVNGGAVLVG